MGKNMESGMVLAMSAWYAQETYTNGKPDGTQTGMLLGGWMGEYIAWRVDGGWIAGRVDSWVGG